MNNLSSPSHEIEEEEEVDSPGTGNEGQGSSSTIVGILESLLRPRKKIHRVPAYMKNKNNEVHIHKNVYDPVVVSMGPYHYGRPELRHAQVFKLESLNAFVSESGKNKSFFYEKILEQIDDIKGCYEDVEYDDQTLAWMMLLDASFLIYQMEAYLRPSALAKTKFLTFFRHFGICGYDIITRDLLLLENQIPLWIIKFLFCSNKEQVLWNKLLLEYLSGNPLNTQLPWVEGYGPFHLLEAKRYFCIVSAKISPGRNMFNMSIAKPKPPKAFLGNKTYQFRSITSLKEKGIYFKPATGDSSYGEMKFTSHSLYGQLELQPLPITTHVFVLYSNLIAYEISPSSNTDFSILSFINFMKSLIESPGDVKILREEGVLFSDLGSDDEVVKVFKDFHTFGVDNESILSELRASIATHCYSKAKTWKAELIYTYFRSPWTIIALLAAISILSLTIFRTFFTFNQVKV